MINTSFRATLVPYIGKSGIVEAYSMLVFFFWLGKKTWHTVGMAGNWSYNERSNV